MKGTHFSVCGRCSKWLYTETHQPIVFPTCQVTLQTRPRSPYLVVRVAKIFWCNVVTLLCSSLDKCANSCLVSADKTLSGFLSMVLKIVPRTGARFPAVTTLSTSRSMWRLVFSSTFSCKGSVLRLKSSSVDLIRYKKITVHSPYIVSLATAVPLGT